jgi:hypothetical protein
MQISKSLIFSIVLFLLAAAYFLTARPFGEKTVSLSMLNNCFSDASVMGGPNDECLKKSVETLLQTYSTKDLMNYVVASTSPNAVITYCHDAAHIIGEEAFIETGSVESAIRQCSRQCNLGCIHGVIAAAVAKDMGQKYLNEDIAHADPATIKKLAAKYCVSGLCHAIGHLLYIGLQNYGAALDSCHTIDVSNTSESCYQGVFMEAVGGSEAFVKSTTTSQRKKDDYAYPCDSVAAPYQHACFVYLMDFQRQLFTKNNVADDAQFNIVRDACESFTSKKTRSDCFVGIGYNFIRSVTGKGYSNSPHSPLKCDALSGTDQDSCIVGFALQNALFDRYISAINYCSDRTDEKRISLCYDVVFQTMKNAAFTDGAVYARCDSSEAPAVCRKEYATYVSIAQSLPQYYVQGLFGDTIKGSP